MPDSSIDYVGGSLKLKGGGIVTKKKRKGSSKKHTSKSKPESKEPSKSSSSVNTSAQLDKSKHLNSREFLSDDEQESKSRPRDSDDDGDNGNDDNDNDGSQTLPPRSAYRNGPSKTLAELRFEEARRQRQSERVASIAASSHKERVANFNSYLETLSEHYDIPKVGPG